MTHQNVVSEAKAILRRSPYPQLKNIEFRMESGTLLLSGVVSSFFLKQMAFELLHEKLNGTPIKNKDIEVKDYP